MRVYWIGVVIFLIFAISFVIINSSTMVLAAEGDSKITKFKVSAKSVYYGETISFSGKLVDGLGYAISGKTITIWEDDNGEVVNIASATTSARGEFKASTIAKYWDGQGNSVEIFAYFPGSGIYKSTRTSIVEINIDKPYKSSISTTPSIITNPKMTPPLERIVPFNPRILDTEFPTIVLDQVYAFESVGFAVDMSNPQDRSQSVTTMLEIQDSDEVILSLQSVSTNLSPGKTSTTLIEWMPEEEGVYTAGFHFWESVDNPSSVAPTMYLTFVVLPSLESEKQQFELESQEIARQQQELETEIQQLEIKKQEKEIEKLQAEVQELETPSEQSGGGCLIATATFGSELAPQVQMLREIRDNTLLETESGSTFMESFHSFYYSFSPGVADLEREYPLFKEAVKLAITPLLTTLSILNYVDIDSEAEMLGYGVSLIVLNVGMYFALPAFVIHRVRKFV